MKNNQVGFPKRCVQGQTPVSSHTQSAGSNKSSQNKKLLVEEHARRVQKMGEDAYAGPVSFCQLCCLYYIPSVSCYSWLPVSAGRGLTRKKVRSRRGPGGNTRSQKIYFTTSTAHFSGRNNTCRRRKDTERDRQGRWERRAGRGRAWLRNSREIYTLRNKAGEFSCNGNYNVVLRRLQSAVPTLAS